MDDIYKAQLKNLQHVYSELRANKSKNILTQNDCTAFLVKEPFNLSEKEARRLTSLSKMTVIQDKGNFAYFKYQSRSFVEFLELLARVAESKRDIKTEQLPEALQRIVECLAKRYQLPSKHIVLNPENSSSDSC